MASSRFSMELHSGERSLQIKDKQIFRRDFTEDFLTGKGMTDLDQKE